MVHPSLFRRQNAFFFFSVSLFFILILAFFYLVPSSNTPPHSHHHSMADENISVLSDKFNSLRALKGHYNGGEFNKDLDGPQGEKYQVMKALGDQLGLPNTPASEILQRLGKPDDLTLLPPGDQQPAAISIMPGPVVPTADQGAMNPALQQQQSQSQPYYLVYYWRGKHDYLYFKIDPVKETVITSGWYNALD